MLTTLQAEEAAAEATRKAREAMQGPDALAFEEKLRQLGFAMQRLQPRDRVADAIQDLEDECVPLSYCPVHAAFGVLCLHCASFVHSASV